MFEQLWATKKSTVAGQRNALQIEVNPIALGWARWEGQLWAAQCHEYVCVVEVRSGCQSVQQAEELANLFILQRLGRPKFALIVMALSIVKPVVCGFPHMHWIFKRRMFNRSPLSCDIVTCSTFGLTTDRWQSESHYISMSRMPKVCTYSVGSLHWPIYF